MVNKKIRPIVFLIACMAQIFAVRTHTLNDNFVPATPRAAIAQKFQDVPVNLANGISDVSIPLYTIKSRSITVPIILKYLSLLK